MKISVVIVYTDQDEENNFNNRFYARLAVGYTEFSGSYKNTSKSKIQVR